MTMVTPIAHPEHLNKNDLAFFCFSGPFTLSWVDVKITEELKLVKKR